MNNEETIRELKEYVRYGDEEFDTPFDKAIRFAIKALSQEPKTDVLDKIRAEIEQEIAYKPMEMWDYRMGLTKALDIIDKYRKESEV